MIRPGAHIRFTTQFEEILEKQWYSSNIEPSLRFMIISSAMIYHELGASRLRIIRLLGNTPEELAKKDSPHYYGCAADVSVRELVDPRVHSIDLMMQKRFPKANFATRRLNDLFPMAQGDKLSTIYNLNPSHLHLECPVSGFKRETQALATWNESGSVGIPQRFTRE